MFRHSFPGRFAALPAAALLFTACAGPAAPAPQASGPASQPAASVSAPSPPAGGAEDGSPLAALTAPALQELPCQFAVKNPGDEQSILQLLVGYEDYFDDVDDRTAVDLPFLSGKNRLQSAFAAQNGPLAVCWGAPVSTAVSADGGATWTQAALPEDTAGVSGLSIGFTSAANGWLAAVSAGGTRFFTTANGGASWQDVYTGPETGSYIDGCFANESVGWMLLQNTGQGSDLLLQTTDGGTAWQPAQAELWPEMQYGRILRHYGTPYYSAEAGTWLLYVGLEREDGLNSSSFYFTPSAVGRQWQWQAPGWPLPQGVSPVDFHEGLGFEIPAAWTPGEGLGQAADGTLKVSEFYLVCNAAFYWARAKQLQGTALPQTENGFDTLISAAEIEAYVLYQYGDDSFDATLLSGYDADAGGVPHSHGHEGLGQGKEIKSVEVTQSGDIEVLFDMIGGGMGEPLYVTGRQRCLYRPLTTPEGVPMFTLLQSRPEG